MALSRALYVGQSVAISAANQTKTYYFPVSSASCEVQKPLEHVVTFGHLNSLSTDQVNLTTCKSTIKTYLGTGNAGSGLTATAIGDITGDGIANHLNVITVSPNGFQMSGIITSLGIDMALGGYGTADLGFAGLGQPHFDAPGNTVSDQNVMQNVLEPVTTVNVSGAVTVAGCASSFKFNLDMPTDTLACLGDPPDAVQSAAQNSIIATKPPYKATITVEGFGVDVSDSSANLALAMTGVYELGHLGIQLPHPKVSAKSFNNAVGTAGATYNYTLEDTSAIFVTL